jgi:SAM-dependent methyltransferase
MARRHPIAAYSAIAAEYRIHDKNLSLDYSSMLRTALKVQRRHANGSRRDPRVRAAWQEGRRNVRQFYATQMTHARHAYRLRGGSVAGSLGRLARIALTLPSVAFAETRRAVWRRVRGFVPGAVRDVLRRRLYPDEPPRVGRVRFGDLRRVTPISLDFGFDRGQPIDRYYMERFLGANADDIRGSVLEIGDNTYTRRFGGSRVRRSDVLHVHGGNPLATFVGDITDERTLPENAFDCMVLIQTLHLIYDVRLAVARIHRALAPGGTVLVTVPGISQIDRNEWGSTWFWSFTPASLRRVFEAEFDADNVRVEQFGNVFAATAFLHGIAQEEVNRTDLDPVDVAYPLVVAVRGKKIR